MKIAINEIKERSIKVFEKAGLCFEDAKIITDVLLETEMRGVFTHGFMRLERYINCIREGGIKTKGEYKVIYDSPSWASVDGNDKKCSCVEYKSKCRWECRTLFYGS